MARRRLEAAIQAGKAIEEGIKTSYMSLNIKEQKFVVYSGLCKISKALFVFVKIQIIWVRFYALSY